MHSSTSASLPSQALTRQLSQGESLLLYYITNISKTEENFDDQRKDSPHQRAGTQEQDHRPDGGRKSRAAGAAAGFLMVCGFYLLKEYFRTKVRKEEDLREYFGMDIPILGTIPKLDK